MSSPNLSYFFNHQSFSDVNLYTKSRKILANSIVLASNSVVFQKTIEEENEKDIFLDSFLEEENEMEMLVSSLYYRSNLVITVDVLQTVAKFGATYQISWIIDESLSFVKSNISHEVCIEMCRIGHKLHENFGHSEILQVSLQFFKETRYLEEIVAQLEAIEDNESYLSLPASLFKYLLQNELRRDEKRIIDLIQRWFKRDFNVIQAMELLPLLQLAQLYLVDQEAHSRFFELLISSEKLTSDDRRKILHESAKSIADSRNCIVTGLGFSKEVSKELSASGQNIKLFLQSPSWRNCSFDDLIMIRQFQGVNDYVFLELFLAWCVVNQITETQVRNVLGLINLSSVNLEYLQDFLEHLRQEVTHLTDMFERDFRTRADSHNFDDNPAQQFATSSLSASQIRNMKLKKHSLTARPCGVWGCWNSSLGVVDLRLRPDSFPFFKVPGSGRVQAPLEHSHNESVCHVYFLVGRRIVSCFSCSWEVLMERLGSEGVVVKVVCGGM